MYLRGYRARRGCDAGLTTTCGALDMKAPQSGWGGIRRLADERLGYAGHWLCVIRIQSINSHLVDVHIIGEVDVAGVIVAAGVLNEDVFDTGLV